MSSLTYLKNELGFQVREWQALTDEDKTTLRRWAREEMEVLGVACSDK